MGGGLTALWSHSSACFRRRPLRAACPQRTIGDIWVKLWTFEAFAATTRAGAEPNDHTLGEDMPWKLIGRMDDEALRVLYEYLTHLSGA